MDLDALYIKKRQGKLSNKDRKYRLANNLCLYCGKEGHRARECTISKGRKLSFLKKLHAIRERQHYEDDELELAALANYTIEEKDELQQTLAWINVVH